jgi:HlyD family secretion protein
MKQLQLIRWPLLTALLLLMFLAYMGFQWWCGPVIDAEVVKKRDMVQTIVASGRVQNPNRIDISAQITSTVASVQVSEGQFVQQGQWLLSLNDHEAQASLQLSLASVALARSRLRQLHDLNEPVAAQAQLQAESNLRAAENNTHRTITLFERGFVGQAAQDEADRQLVTAQTQLLIQEKQWHSVQNQGSEMANAQAALQQALAGVDAAKARLAYTRILAPRSGLLIARHVEAGDGVQAGKVLMVLSPAGSTELVIQLDEKNMKWVRLGQMALVSADAYPDELFEAKVSFINPGVDPLRGSVEVKLKVLEAPSFLAQDMTVSVDIEVNRQLAVLQIPISAVHSMGQQPWVLLVRDHRAAKTPVHLGLHGPAVVQILSGLQAGDLLVSHVNIDLADGSRLRVRKP